MPALYKGLFFEDPPMVLRPRPGTSQKITDAKTAIISFFLDECQFKTEVKWGLEQLAHLGTGIWKWGVQRIERTSYEREVTEATITTGVTGPEKISDDTDPKITPTKKVVSQPIFEFRPLTRVLVDPALKVGDIRRAGYVIDVRYMDFYELRDLKNNNLDKDGKQLPGWTWDEYISDEKLKELWIPPVEALSIPAPIRSDVQTQTVGVVHHGEEDSIATSADPLAKKLEVLEYWDKQREIIAVNRKKVIYTDGNKFKCIPFLSANWWNRPKAFYGMGIGLTVGQNQRVDQGTINSILKILSFGVNPIYLRSRDSNSPTQMIRTGIGKILSVDGDVDKSFKLLESPRVPAETWVALQNSEAATESTSGADQALVQGSAGGKTAGIGRSAAGAGYLASASATRMDGPLDNFIEQVFIPFLYILDEIVFNYVSDQEIKDILGQELGEEFLKDLHMREFHKGKVLFEALAGASLSAKRTMAQSLTLITQILQNPEIQQFLAEVQGKYIDWEVILGMWLEASEWKDRQDVIKPMTPEMKAALQAKQQAASQAALNTQMTLNDQKAQQKSQLEDQASENRVKRDLVRYATETSAKDLATEGEPGTRGFGSDVGM